MIIDPNNQIGPYLEKLISENKNANVDESKNNKKKSTSITRIKASDKNLYSKLRNAVKHGQKIIVEDSENIDPILYPLLKRELKISNENNCEFLEFAGFKEI